MRAHDEAITATVTASRTSGGSFSALRVHTRAAAASAASSAAIPAPALTGVSYSVATSAAAATDRASASTVASAAGTGDVTMRGHVTVIICVRVYVYGKVRPRLYGTEVNGAGVDNANCTTITTRAVGASCAIESLQGGGSRRGSE